MERTEQTALELLERIRGMTAPVDLRPFISCQGNVGPAIKTAAEKWKLSPEQVFVVRGEKMFL